MKEHRKNNKITSKNAGHQGANTSNQAMIEAQNEFKDFTSKIIEEFKISNQENEPPQIAQQAACTSSHSNELKEMKDQIKMLVEQNNKIIPKIDFSENAPTDKQRKSDAQMHQEQDIKPWLYCFTCRCQQSHSPSNLHCAT